MKKVSLTEWKRVVFKYRDLVVFFLNPFLFIKSKRLFIISESFSVKKRPNMFSEGNAAHPVGFDSQSQIVMAVWHTFLKFELAICKMFLDIP
jgi:hypothetical protein